MYFVMYFELHACYYVYFLGIALPVILSILIIESVDSICRDGADMPISFNKSNGSELPNADILSLFRQNTCSESASIHFNTLKVRKIYSYMRLQLQWLHGYT